MTSPLRSENYSNFVLNFKTEEIDQVKNDIISLREGCQFFYAIDTYDIINHYLPYIDSNFFSTGNRNQIAQRAIAYDKFFKPLQSYKMIVLDEYKQELFAAKTYIEKQIKNAGILKNNIEALVRDVSQMNTGHVGDRERIRKNIELILFLLILSENRGSIHNNFFEFLKTKLSIFKFDTADTRRNELLDEIFSNTAPSAAVEQVYDAFVDSTTYELSRFETDFERYTYLDNTYRDIEAIDRLYAINSKLSSEHQDENVKFVYLSSAPFKTRKIMSIFSVLDPSSPKRAQNPGALDFHRNIFQCFLFKLLAEEFPNANDPKPLAILDALKEMVLETSSLQSSTGKKPSTLSGNRNDTVIETLKAILDRYSSNIDNHFYFKMYAKYRPIFESAESGQNDKIADILNKVQTYIKEEKIIGDGNDIFYNIGQYKYTFVLSQIFQGESDNIFIHVNFGKDIVRDSFHHLPYLLFLENTAGQPFYDDLYPLFNTISNFSTYKFERVEDITPHLRKIFKKLTADIGSLNNHAVRLLLTSYLYLICGVTSQDMSESSFYDKELMLIESTRKQKKVMENSILSIVRSEDGKRMEIEKKRNSLINEFDYVLLWLLRRTQQFEEAIELGNDLVSRSDDGRFAHGLALAYGSQAYSMLQEDPRRRDRTETILSLLETSFVYLNKSKIYYLGLLGKQTNPHAKALLNKTLMAIDNSIADEALRRFEIQGGSSADPALLDIARSSIEEIKGACKETGIDYDHLAIYNYTEAELLYFETQQHLYKSDLRNAHLKIIDATKVIATAKSQKNSMDAIFHQVEKNIDSLRSDILKRQGMIT